MKLINKKFFTFSIILVFTVLVLSLLVPLPKPLINAPFATTLLDENNHLLGAQIASDEQWHFKLNEELNQKYIISVINFEDKRFFNHIGVDFIALARALYTDIKHGRIVSGGSTITMQLARISQENKPRTIIQKLLEIWLAIRIEIQYSKNEILRMYAESAPFGGNTVGISAASWRYFGRSIKQLSWAEATLLAVLPNAPSLMHLTKSRKVLKRKRDKLLTKLYHKGIITKLDYELSFLEPLPDKPRRIPNTVPLLMGTLKKEYPQKAILHTTINKELQEKINLITRSNSIKLANLGVYNLSILVLENSSMEVKAYVGNKAFMNKGIYANQLDITKRPRSTGSTLKPLLFASMIDEGFLTPNTLIADIPSYYSGYMPTNYDERYRGAVTTQEALIQSLNVPTVKILYDYGYKKLYENLKQYGMTTLHRNAEEYGLSLILGGAETTLHDLVNIYANISNTALGLNFGKFLKIKTLLNQEAKYIGNSPISQGAAYLTLEALKDLKRPGLDGKLKGIVSRSNIAWKTGTSYGLRDAWAIGTTPEYTVGIWAGNATGEGVSDLSGTATSAPIMLEVFGVLNITEWYKKPLDAFKKIDVCKEDGYLGTDKCQSIKIDMPLESKFRKVSPNRIAIHIDKVTGLRVDSNCAAADSMKEVHFFILPPTEAYFYKQVNSSYKDLPPYRHDCKSNSTNIKGIVEINYPVNGHSIYLPQDLDGSFGKVTLKARHKNKNETLYWHIDDKYISMTKDMHDMSLYINPGKHTLMIMDPKGNRVKRNFTVLAKDGTF